MGIAASAIAGGIVGVLLYIMPLGVIFGFPSSLPAFAAATIVGGILGAAFTYY
jgi:hypothetical protein